MSWNQVQSLAAHLYAWFQTAESNEDYLMRWLAGCGALALSLASIKFGWKFTKGTCKGCRWTWRLVFPKGELSEFGTFVAKEINEFHKYSDNQVRGSIILIKLIGSDKVFFVEEIVKPCGGHKEQVLCIDDLLTEYDKTEIVRLAGERKNHLIEIEKQGRKARIVRAGKGRVHA